MLNSLTTQERLLPLTLVAQGDSVLVHEIRGARELRQRLFDLGLHPGALIRVVKNEHSGPLIIAVKQDGRLALGHGMCHKILVALATNNQGVHRP
jgi:ferrous iron transport protein A